MNILLLRLAAVATAVLATIAGAHGAEPYGRIGEKYARLNGAGGPLGAGVGAETDAPHGGRLHRFQAGTIYWHPEIGEAFAVWGAIGEKHSQSGGVNFGYPITDESPTPDGRGRFNHFRAVHSPGKPESSIYWTPETGANAVYGLIREAWARGGWERGELGYPTSDEFQDGKFRRSNFERGHILWAPDTGIRIVRAGAPQAAGSGGEDNIGTVQQPLVGGQPVDEETLARLGLVSLNSAGRGCSGALLAPGWVLTAAHCVEGEPASATSVTAAWDERRSGIATEVIDFRAEGLDIAIVRAPAIPWPTLSDPPALTTRANDRLGYALSTYGRGIHTLARRAGGVDMPSQSDGAYRTGIFEVAGATPRTVTLKGRGGQTIAGGDSGGPSYIKLWKDPNRHELGAYEEIVGVSSECGVRRLKGKENTGGWTWVSQIESCAIATTLPVRDRLLEIISQPAAPATDYRFPVGTNDSPKRALYAASLDRPLVPHPRPTPGAELVFDTCSGLASRDCPVSGAYEVWSYASETKRVVHLVSRMCLASSSHEDGALVTLQPCYDSYPLGQWTVVSDPPGGATWVELKNVATGLCATAEFPPRSGAFDPRGVGGALISHARLVARPCKRQAAQRFEPVDRDWYRRNGPR